MGVAEGMSEIPPGQLLPFELNLDYLQGGVCLCVCVCLHACMCACVSQWLLLL